MPNAAFVTGEKCTGDAVKVLVRGFLLNINEDNKLTPRGLDFLVLCGEIIKHEGPFREVRRSGVGGSSSIARPRAGTSRVDSPGGETVQGLFKGDRNNVFRFFTSSDVFLDFLKTARAEEMNYMLDPNEDRALVEIMMRDEVLLLGGDASMNHCDRPNVALIELIRWLLENRARTQLAWVILKCLHLFDDMLEELPWTMKDLQKEAAKVQSEKFFWFGQLASEEQLKALSERCVTCMRRAIICQHNKQRSFCRDCNGSQICQHDRHRSSCRDCNDGSKICQHNTRREICRDCHGKQICQHDRQLSFCRDCNGSQICEHDRQRSFCRACKESGKGGSQLCQHYKRFERCRVLERVNALCARREAKALGKRKRDSV